jgi:hypothetical protein
MAITNQVFEAKSIGLDNYYAKEKAAIEGSKMTEEQKAAKMKALDEEVTKKKAQLARKRAIADKLSAIVSAGVNTAVAITQALASAPPPIGPALAAIVGGLGVAQVAAIAATPIPAFATGGAVFGPTMAMVGDNPNASSDPEIIAPLSKLNNMIGGGGVNGVVEFIIRGNDLYGILDKENKRMVRVG